MKQEMAFTEETGDCIYIGNRRLYLRRKQEMAFTEETGDGIYIGTEIVFT